VAGVSLEDDLTAGTLNVVETLGIQGNHGLAARTTHYDRGGIGGD
jgi:hypothetical protein